MALLILWEGGARMPVSELRLVKRCAEFLPKEQVRRVPRDARGIYTLLKYRPKLRAYDVVYVGMAGRSANGGIVRRLRRHTKQKPGLWTHFSVFEVWDNIREEEIRELEGILRHIYRSDIRANSLAKQKSFKRLTAVRNDDLELWKQ